MTLNKKKYYVKNTNYTSYSLGEIYFVIDKLNKKILYASEDELSFIERVTPEQYQTRFTLEEANKYIHGIELVEVEEWKST